MQIKPWTVALLVPALIAGCATTEYMGPLDAVTPDPPPGHTYPPTLPKVVDVSGTSAVLLYPSGGRQLIAKDSTFVHVEISPGIGALEGFLGGTAVGLAAGAGGSSQCQSSDCAATAILASALITGAIGALYGAMVGKKTTYVFGPRPSY